MLRNVSEKNMYRQIIIRSNLVVLLSCNNKSLELRRQYKIDSILSDFNPPEVLINYVSGGLVGQDKLLNPCIFENSWKLYNYNNSIKPDLPHSVWISRYGKTDIKGVLRSAKKIDFIMYVIYLIELSISKVISEPNKYKRVPDAIVQTTIIIDMEGLSMQHVTNKKGIQVIIQVA